MIRHLIHLLALTVSIIVAAKIVPGLQVRSFWGAVLFALIFAVVDKILFLPFAVLTLPLVILSLGLFLIVIHALLFWFAGKLVGGVSVANFSAALFGSVLTSVVNYLITVVFRL